MRANRECAAAGLLDSDTQPTTNVRHEIQPPWRDLKREHGTTKHRGFGRRATTRPSLATQPKLPAVHRTSRQLDGRLDRLARGCGLEGFGLAAGQRNTECPGETHGRCLRDGDRAGESDDEPMDEHGPPPDSAVIMSLLTTRYPIERTARLQLALTIDDEGARRATLSIDRTKTSTRPAERYGLVVRHTRGGEPGWDLLVDALDALLGMLVESDFAHRELPAGEGVEFQGGEFFVDATYVRPDVERQADTFLGDDA